MIEFERVTLENGLRILVHVDPNTPIAAVNTLYDVGARDEDPNRTGFAHLFEHLMFGGSIHVPNFDAPLQSAGGQNNAFTNNDFTNYYITLPAENLDTALWLESDRMLSLAFTPESLEVQRKVVIEEFQQRYLNQPYGDLWLHLRPLAYKVHPYRWATIGKEILHIEEARMEEVKSFFHQFYHPSNAIMAVGSALPVEEVVERISHWFSDIPGQDRQERSIASEPEQTENRTTTLRRDVPQAALHMAWHMSSRLEADYYCWDLLSDILGNGKSSRLYKALVVEKRLFTSVSAYILGSIDPGLFMVSGMLKPGVGPTLARQAVLDEISNLKLTDRDVERVANKAISTHKMGEVSVLSKTMSLAYFELLGDAAWVNQEEHKYQQVNRRSVEHLAQKLCAKPFNELIYESA
jgi:predicted Zn-dependent peptidase